MATKDLWQFRSVVEYGENTLPVYDLGKDCALSIESFPYPEGSTVVDVSGNTVSLQGGDYVIKFGLPSDTLGFALNGVARIICSTSEFPRSIGQFDSTKETFADLEVQLDINDRDSSKYQAVFKGVKGCVVYATICYYSPIHDAWLTSPNNLMSRCTVRGDHGEWGQILFDQLPRYMRKIDEDNEGATKSVLSSLGIALDDFSALLEYIDKSTYTPERVDAGALPYIDQLLAWPTNFELRESLRRYETVQAVSLWKTKSSANALELVMQNTIGWDVEIYEGKQQVFTLNSYNVAQPADWIEGEIDADSSLPADQQPCGIWNDVSKPFFTTWDPNNSSPYTSPENTNLVLPSQDGWQNPNGVLVKLLPTADSRTVLSSLALKKAKNIVPLFIPHYAQVFFTVQDLFQETLRVHMESEFDDDFGTLYPTEPLSLDIEVIVSNYKSNLCVFHTWNVASNTNDTRYRTFHNGIDFLCSP
jgi:hypothetical protein